MLKEQAISLLTQVKKIILGSESWLDSVHQPIEEAFGMAMESLKQPEPKWTPVSERLPEELTTVLITDKDGDVFLATFIEVINGYAEWTTDGIIAWMPLPEPYKEVRDEYSN